MHDAFVVVASIAAAGLTGLAYWFTAMVEKPEPALWTTEDEADLDNLGVTLWGPR